MKCACTGTRHGGERMFTSVSETQFVAHVAQCRCVKYDVYIFISEYFVRPGYVQESTKMSVHSQHKK